MTAMRDSEAPPRGCNDAAVTVLVIGGYGAVGSRLCACLAGRKMSEKSVAQMAQRHPPPPAISRVQLRKVIADA